MPRASLALTAVAAAMASSGCVNFMEERMAQAPEWFEARAREVKGEGYPSLSDVPELLTPVEADDAWRREAEALKGEAAAIESNPEATAPVADPEGARARAAQLRAQIETGDPAPAASSPD